jgi:hypothetical protein
MLSSVPTLRSCAARCKRARLQGLQNAPLGTLGHVLRSEGSSERTLLPSAAQFWVLCLVSIVSGVKLMLYPKCTNPVALRAARCLGNGKSLWPLR